MRQSQTIMRKQYSNIIEKINTLNQLGSLKIRSKKIHHKTEEDEELKLQKKKSSIRG